MRARVFRLCAAHLLAAAVLFSEVPYKRIEKAESEPGSWLTYSGSYSAQRYSRLDQITPRNVAGLKPVWVYQVKQPGYIETTPLVADGVMYITEPPSTVTALDIHTGRPLWTWSPDMPKDVLHLGFPPVNRGVAILDDTLFVGTLDAHLVALDAASGAVRWDVVVADNKTGHAITAAPLALEGKIIVGISGGEAGIRGFIDAYHPG
ncbi:MAG: PQQ-binding-like beta-propeller repeat protein, partial [bacterium]|nr:PQQ-binding-like beta-propeller repeat protein [bacterium]